MKAPEKLYINGFSAFATEPVKNGVEYVSKDVLLEWAKEQIEVYDAHLKDHYDIAWWHERYAFQQVINKLNQM